MDTNVSSKRNF